MSLHNNFSKSYLRQVMFMLAFIMLNALDNKMYSHLTHRRYLARIPISRLSVMPKDEEGNNADINVSGNEERQVQPLFGWNRRNVLIAGAVSASSGMPKFSIALAEDKERKNETYQTVTLPSGLKYIELREGTGPTPRYGQFLTIGYTGYVKVATKTSTANPNEPPPIFDKVDAYLVKHGNRRLIPGLEEGIHTVRYSSGLFLLLLSTSACRTLLD